MIPFRFNEAQVELYKKVEWFREHRMPVRIVICKSRRAGLSTGVAGLIYDDTVTHPNTNSLIVANEKNPAEFTLKMCTNFWRYTPEFFEINGARVNVRPKLPPQFNNNPPKDRLSFDEPLNSTIYVATSRSLDAYLGYGFQNVHATEASRYADGHELFRALYPTITTDEHSALYVESTPNGQEGKGAFFYMLCMDAKARKNTQYGEMALVFIPWWKMTNSFSVLFKSDDEKAAFIRAYTKAEADLLKRFPQITPEQLLWRRMILAGPTFNQDEDMFDQEYPTDIATSFLLSGWSVFGRKAIKRLSAQTREPIWEGDVYWGDSDLSNKNSPTHEVVRRPHFYTKGEAQADRRKSHVNERTYNNLRVFRWPRKEERLFICCDVGGGNPESRDGDWSTMVVGVLNELERDEVIMTWRGRLNPLAFAEVASALCWGLRRMVGDKVVAPELVPEWTGPGQPMCVYIDQKNLYPNLYRYQALQNHGQPRTKSLGWESNAKTKPLAVNAALRMVTMDLIDIPDENLVTEMASYRQTDSFGDDASFNGAAGRHDDLVSAFTILCAILRLRSVRLPGEADVVEMPLFESSGDDDDYPSFDPFHGEVPELRLPGSLERDFDDENSEETLWWTGG